MRLVILGAGQSGRGFLARLFCDQAQLTFVDRDRALVDRLNEAGGYEVRFFDGSPAVRIAGYRAYPVDSPEAAGAVAACDAALVSVRGENAAAAGRWLIDRLSGPTCVVACENAAEPARLFPPPLCDAAASGAIFCTSVEDGPLDILSERYPSLVVSERGATPALRALRGVEVTPDFGVLMKRKLYTYNAASGIIAYLGAAAGYADYAEAANDRRIERALDDFYASINAAVCAEYGVDPREQARFAAASRRKFQNRAIADSIGRNAASPERKLGASERIIAPMRLIEAHGGDASVLYDTAAAALAYAGAKTRAQAAQILGRVSGLAPGDRQFQAIIERIDKGEAGV